MIHHFSKDLIPLSFAQLVSQLLCTLAKEKTKSCIQNVSFFNGIIFHCLLLNWHLQINSLVLHLCSLNTISSVKPYHKTKLISRFKTIQKFLRKDSLKRFPKNYFFFVFKKTFLTDWIFYVFKKQFARFFFISLALSR